MGRHFGVLIGIFIWSVAVADPGSDSFLAASEHDWRGIRLLLMSTDAEW
jgi:hypothetical protein